MTGGTGAASPGEPAPDQDDGHGADAARRTGFGRLVGAVQDGATATRASAEHRFDRYRNRPLVDLGLRIVERDRRAAGSVVGSAIAFRLFLFFVPLLLFFVGVAGFFATVVSSQDVNDAGIAGSLATQIDSALNQASSTRWIAVATGLIGMITTGRTLSKALTQASCLAWQLPVRAKASVRVVGGVIGVVVGMGILVTIVNRIRQELGVAVTGVSLVAVLVAYTVISLFLQSLLPRPTKDPGALLPGAALVALTLTGLQAVSQLYLPDRFSRASELYGAIGVTIVTLGWFFIAGRALVLAMVLDAVVFERFGSISELVFGLPVLRALPRRWPWLRRYFDLDGEQSGAPAGPDDPPDRDASTAGGAPGPDR